MKLQAPTTLGIGVVLCLILTSCTNNELSRKEAGQIITDFYQYPNVEMEKFHLEMNLYLADKYKTLIDGGYLATVPNFMNYILPPDMIVTERGEAYRKDANFATAIRELKEVTGIRFDDEAKTKATVEFTVIRDKVTPFGKIREYKNGDVMNYTVSIERYDDGWRVTSEQTENFPVSDFPNVEEFK